MSVSFNPPSNRAAKLTFDGDTDVNHLIAGDLSTFRRLRGYVKCTKADTAAGDKLIIRLQETLDGITWNDRAVVAAITGDQSPSVTAPETREFTLVANEPLSADEEMLEPSGSAGGTALAEGEVRNGPFAPPYRVSTATPTQNPGRYAAWRFFLDFTDVTTDDADFEGTIELWGDY